MLGASYLVDTAQAVGSIAAILVGLGIIGRTVLGIYRVAKRIEATNDLVHRELHTNGGSSLRDAINRIEAKADHAIERINTIEQRPTATAIVVTPENGGGVG